MSEARLPLILEPDELERHLGEDDLLVIDLSKDETYQRMHIPGAVHLEYSSIVHAEPPRLGLLPDDERLREVLSSAGIGPNTHVVAYDDEGGGRAGRLLWTLEVAGHTRFSLLNGGLHAWANEGHSLSDAPVRPSAAEFTVRHTDEPVADRAYVLEHLYDSGVVVLDARSPQEFQGVDVRAQRGGHIPNAVNVDWTNAMDPNRNMRLKSEADLRALYESRGITPDKTVVTHCQTHHRSAHTYIVLKALGYSKVKGYPGSWSDWGNVTDVPVEP